MPLISKTISNLIGGISQQTPTVRLEGQCEDSLNGIPSIVEGWKKRKGTKYIGKLYPHAGENTKIHCTEREIIAVTGNTIDIFGMDGAKKQTINAGAADDYLEAAKADELILRTVADTTFILNRAAVPQMTAEKTQDPYEGRGIVHVKQVNWDTTYNILNAQGTVIASCTSPDGVVDPNVDGSTDSTWTGFNNGIKITYTGGTATLKIHTGVSSGTVVIITGSVMHLYLDAATDTATLASRINTSGKSDWKAELLSTQPVPYVEATYTFSTPENPEAGDDDPKWLDFSYIASALASQISGATAVKNVILLPAGDYSVTDSQNGQFLIYVKEKIAAFADLPTVAPNGFTVKITTGSGSDDGDYYVKAATKDGADFGDCLWEECAAPGIQNTINGATMPHTLLRQQDGSFTYQTASWEKRKTGDDISNPLPTFIGRQINDIFYYKNRLGFLADENVIMSRASEPFAFFFSTVQTLADNEPIDAAGSHHKTVILRHAIALSERLYLFGENAQFILSEGDAILSPKTASVDTLTEYAADIATAPVSSGRSIFFPTRNTKWEGIYEGLISDEIFQASAVTSHVAALIPAGLRFLITSPNAEVIAAASAAAPETLYLYKYTWAGSEKVQSAWTRLKFRGALHTAFFVNTQLYICTISDDGLHLETTDFDEGMEEGIEGLCLDRRINADRLKTVQDEDGITTVITLPYGVKEGEPPELLLENGKLIKTAYKDENTVTTQENIKAKIRAAGYRYEAAFTFSEIVFVPSGQNTALTQGRLQLRKIWVMFTGGSHFTIAVTPLYRRTYENHYWAVAGSGEAVIGSLYKADGRFEAPVLSKSDQTKIKLTTDSIIPLCLVSAGWEGYYVCRSTPS